MEEELKAATDLQRTENSTQMGLDGFLAEMGDNTDLIKMALPEIVWVLGRTWVVPRGVPSPRL